MSKEKILVLAAIPNGLCLDKEIREIEEAIKRAVKRDLFEIKIRTAVRPQDIRRAIAEERPQIVHFCGHGTSDGSLVLEDNVGNHKPVLPDGLAALFELYVDDVKCVLLNACYSFKSAQAISQHISYVIGMNQPIEDEVAIVFAQGFYDGLGYDNINNQDVISRAFREGIVAIQLENLLQGSIPSMWKFGIAQTEIVPTPTSKSSFDEFQNDRSPDYLRPEIVEPPQTDDLLSDRNVDYTRLRDLLKAGNWFDADDETYLVMLKVVGRENSDWIRDKELLNFPCTDLRTIDSLWVKYSNGRFGFSVQKKISLEVSGVPDGKWSEQAWEKFGDQVGWRMNGSWISHSQITFDTRATVGHLPVCGVLALGFLSHCHFGTLLSRPDL